MDGRVGVGSEVAGFRVDSLLGEGATAVVYLAEEKATGRRVALKLLAPELARDERFRRRFLRESEIAASLQHPNAVETVASGEDESGTLYLASAYVDGSDLRSLLRREDRLEPEHAVRLVEQVAAALDASHAAGLVHRDVKPGNILLERDDDDERAYICDFGLARHVSSVSSLTGDRGFVGTIDYVSPEQIEGGTIDARADVYSLGCVLFEALTGARPFDRESELSVVFAHLNEAPPSATELRPELPAAFDDVFRVALAKAPDERFASCSELARAARAALRGEPVRRRRSRSRLVLAGAVAAVLAAGAIAGVLATESGSPGGARGPATISERAIDGLALGHTKAWYIAHVKPPGYKPSIATPPGYPELSFQYPGIGVYFPQHGAHAHIITTWNPRFRTAAGIGPCSTLAEMHRVYGKQARPNWSGTSPNGKIHNSWQLGRNILFMTDDRKTISVVVLFKGVPFEKHGNSPRDFANYIGANETPCK